MDDVHGNRAQWHARMLHQQRAPAPGDGVALAMLGRRQVSAGSGVSAPGHIEQGGVTMESGMQLTQLARFKAPLGGQEIDLQQVDYAAGGMSLLRIRIKEGSRFTVFDIDPATAANWGLAMQQWAQSQEGANG